MKPQNDAALKEWSSVVVVLMDGKQALLIRKGGLADKGKRFAVEEDEFFLYPSYLHQQVDFVKADYVGGFEATTARQAAEGSVRFESYAVAKDAIPVAAPDLLQRLDGLHIWNGRFIEQRLRWQPHSPAWVVLLRVYRLPQPIIVEEQRRYRGCRSWVKLAEPLSTDGATPVLSDAEFDRYTLAVHEALSGHVAAPR